MGMKEFLPESDFVYGLRTDYVTQVRNFDTCLYISDFFFFFKYLPKIKIFTYTVLVCFMRTANG